MEMHTGIQVVFIFLLLAWNSTALPCGGGSWGGSDVGVVTCPEEVILVTFQSEGGDDVEAPNSPDNPHRIPTDELVSSDDSLNGEVVESADIKNVSQVANIQSDPLSSGPGNDQKVSQQSGSDADCEMEVTTVSIPQQ